MRTFLTTASLAVLLLALAPSTTRADDNEDAEITRMAQEHYKLGRQAFQAGKYPEAIKELKKAYLLKRLPPLLVNIAKTYEKLNDPENAIYYYKKYLAEAPPDAKDREAVQQALDELQHPKTAPAEPGEQGEQAPEELPAAPVPSETARPKRETPPATAPAEEAPPPRRAAPAAPQPPHETQPAAPPPSRAPAVGAAAPTEWSHTPIDAVPPGQPVDVRVQTPVMKGVKVWLYYRPAGQEKYTALLMKRHGAEKIARIPASATEGKSLQYYIEAKDPTGTVIKSSGSSLEPNLVMIDPSAPPQVAEGAGEVAEEAGAAASEQNAPAETERPVEQPRVVERRPPPPPPPPKPKREAPPLDEYGYVGLGVTGLGVAAAVAGGVLLYLATTRASAIAADACPAGPNCPMKGGKPNPYYFNDPNASPNDFDFQNQGHLYNNAGIGLVVAGGVLAAAGVAFTIVDNVLIAPARWKSHPHKAKEKDKEHRPDGDSAPYIPQSSIEHLHVTPVLGPNVAGLSAGFSF